jgi:hypothetical protein
MPRHCSANSHGASIPATVRRCAMWSATAPRHCTTHSRTAHRTLEKGRRNPRRDDAQLLCARTGRRRDVRPVGAVTSVAISPVRPSPSPRRHPATASPYPTLWNMRRQDTATPATVPRTASRRRHPRAGPRAAAGRAPSTPPPSKPLLYGHRTRHGVPIGARFARTTVYSMTLYAVPPHVGECGTLVNCRLLGL